MINLLPVWNGEDPPSEPGDELVSKLLAVVIKHVILGVLPQPTGGPPVDLAV